MREFVYRRVPLLLSASTLLGGAVQMFGWVFLGFGTIFSAAFLQMADFSFHTYGDGTEITKAKVVKVESSGASENGSRILKYFFVFTDSKGLQQKGLSYSKNGPQEGATVEIEYKKDEPGFSRIKGMRFKPFGPFIAFVIIFPLVGFCFVAIPMFLNRKRVRLLHSGLLTTGTLCDKAHTNMRINRRMVYKYTFRFKDSKGKEHFFTEKTHHYEKIEDEHEERVLYLPEDPSVACLVDLLGSKMTFDKHGELVDYSRVKSFFSMVIPAIVVSAIVVAAVIMGF